MKIEKVEMEKTKLCIGSFEVSTIEFVIISISLPILFVIFTRLDEIMAIAKLLK